jgi:hypothetical protein
MAKGMFRCYFIFKSFFLFPVLLISISLGACDFQADTSRRLPTDVERQIRTVLELPSYEYLYRDIIYISDQAEFLGFRHKDTQLLFAVDVRLQAGVNLKKGVQVTPISAGGLSINLPAAEILLIDADENSITQYFKKEFGGQIERLAYYDEISLSKERIRKEAVDRGVLTQAQSNAASVVRSLLQSQGISPVEVKFQQSRREGSQ